MILGTLHTLSSSGIQPMLSSGDLAQSLDVNNCMVAVKQHKLYDFFFIFPCIICHMLFATQCENIHHSHQGY